MRKYWWLSIVVGLLILWWVQSHSDSVAKVHFSTVQKATLRSTVATNGKVEPAEWAAARAETAGVVRAISVQRGQEVQAGQSLVKLDIAAAQAALAGAVAQEEEAQAENATVGQGGKAATVADLNDRIASAQAALRIAQRVYDSDQRLLQQTAVTKLQVDNDADALTRAKLNLSALQNQKKAAVTASDKTVAQAKLHDAQAAVALAQHRVGLGDIRSPMAGTVYQFDLKIGAYLEPGATVALVGNLNQVKVTVYVDEPDLGRVALDMPVTITWEARPGQSWSGRVNKLPTEVVALGTRTVGEVTTVIENPNHDLLPGVSVNATIVSRVVNDAVTIPKAALRTLAGTSGVYKLDGRTVRWTPIRAGISDINNVQVLSGLKEGERVADRVVDPSDTELSNGLRVTPAQ